MNKFFVYGTLMSGCSNHHVILKEAIESVEPAVIDGMDLYRYARSSFPAMIYGQGQVIGQVITIKKKYLNQVTKMMDRLEGYIGPNNPRNFYDRVRSLCTLSTGSEVEVNVYLFNESNQGLTEPITHGDFRKYIETKMTEVL